MAATSVAKLYRSVIDDVINSVRDVFLDEGVDEQVLTEIKQTWERKLLETKAIDHGSKEDQNASNQLNSNGQSVIQSSNTTQRGNQNSGNSNRNSQVPRENQVANHNQQQAQFHVQQSQPQQNRQVQQGPQQMHSVVVSQPSTVPGARPVATTSSPLTQQLTLAPGPLVQPTLFQYTTGEGVDGQKTVTLLPQKVTFAFNPQTQGIQTVMSSPAAAATLALPPELTASLLQQFTPGNVINVTQAQTSVVQHTNTVNSGNSVQYQPSNTTTVINQQGTSANNRPQQPTRIEPLNSEDDVSDEDPIELFDTDNVVVCQYDKITRSRNKWKFHLKDGIMNLQSKDYVFQKASGDAE
ncbi:transcription initiation factor IIA subunit 1-like isoform X2, partial [Dinothrombium tinctorium]